MTNQSPT